MHIILECVYWVLISVLPLLVISILIVIIAGKGKVNIEQLAVWTLHLMIAPLVYFTISNRDEEMWHNKRMRGRGVTEDREKPLIKTAHNSVDFDGE